MKILFLTHTFPHPLNDGARLHIYHLIRELSKKHKLFLLSLNDVPVTDEDRKAVEALGVKIGCAIHHEVPQNPLLRIANALFDRVPFCVRQFQSKPFENELLRFLNEERVDVVFDYYLVMIPYRKHLDRLPVTFCSADAVSMMFERNIRSEPNVFRKIYTYLQWKKIRNFEATWIPKFSGTMVVSPVDREYLLNHCPGQKIIVSPSGVDTRHFAPQGGEEKNIVLFRGVMNFQPNVDAVRYFYREIFPFVLKEIPEAKFYVVGKFPPSDLLDASQKDPRLVVTGLVPDMREWMAKASVIVSPMRIGSGIKNKILESMAMEKAIVGTSLSCVSIDAKDGEHLLMEDDPQAFAAKVCRLLKNPELRAEMGKRARQFVEKNYSWARCAADLEKLYQEAIDEFNALHGK